MNKGSFGATRKPADGIQGVQGGIPSIGQLRNLLGRQFSPASSTQVPLSATTKSGHRNIAGIVVSANLTLVAGGTTWTFPTPFLVRPSIAATPFGPPPAAGTTLYISMLSLTAVSITSTSNADVREIQIIASGNPN